MQKAHLLFVMVLILTFFLTITSAQEEDLPVVAIIRFGDNPALSVAEQGTLDMFAAYGYVDGENIEYIFGDAQLDINVTGDLINFVIEQGADVIMPIGTPLVVAAVRETSEMEDPPAVIFSVVADAVGSNIVQSTCIKPDHVTGTQILLPYDVIMDTMLTMDSSIDKIGIIYNEELSNSALAVATIEDLAEDLGIETLVQSVTSGNVVAASAETMLMAEIDAFMIPPDGTVFSAMSDLNDISVAAGIPIFVANTQQAYNGATIAMGPDYYAEGVTAAQMAIYYLTGDLDIATTAISNPDDINIGINLDTAAQQGLIIPENLLRTADFVIEDGESTESTPELAEIELEERMEVDLAFLADLECTSERIEEEQATLDTADE